eukprot:362319-Chlamydomonas_euryale.AAC.2
MSRVPRGGGAAAAAAHVPPDTPLFMHTTDQGLVPLNDAAERAMWAPPPRPGAGGGVGIASPPGGGGSLRSMGRGRGPGPRPPHQQLVAPLGMR